VISALSDQENLLQHADELEIEACELEHQAAQHSHSTRSAKSPRWYHSELNRPASGELWHSRATRSAVA